MKRGQKGAKPTGDAHRGKVNSAREAGGEAVIKKQRAFSFDFHLTSLDFSRSLTCSHKNPEFKFTKRESVLFF